MIRLLRSNDYNTWLTRNQEVELRFGFVDFKKASNQS